MSNAKAVIFDFDGTLVDTMGGFADLAADIMHRRFGTPIERARHSYLETSGLPFRQQLEIIYPDDARNDEASREFEAAKQETFFSETFADDVKRTISQLRQRGYLVMVSSNNRQDLVDRFVAREPEVQFHEVLGARQDFFKGHDHFEYIRRKFGIGEDEMVFIGDSLKDAERAISSHVRFVGKLGTFDKTDFETQFPGVATISNISDLPKVIQ